MAEKTTLDVNGVSVGVSNLNKVFYPKTGFTKGQVIDYYVRISPYLLPHLNNRPITLKRSVRGRGSIFLRKAVSCGAPQMDTNNQSAEVGR